MKFSNYIKENKESDDKLRFKLIRMFNRDKKVTLKELNEFALNNDIGITDLYEIVFDILNSFLYRRNDNIKVDKKELELGIKHELEHTKDTQIAKIIALDHLKQIKNYYTLLSTFDED